MLAIQNVNLISLADTLISLLSAFVLGGLIGFERQYRQRTAGLRTNVLVAVGAAIFVDIANRLNGNSGAVHVIAYVVSGIGFLGAGVIMREEGNVRGLNTAATLWCSGAVGACAGADLIFEAVLGTMFVLLANTALRPLGNLINRQPIDSPDVEVTCTVCVIASLIRQKEAMRELDRILDAHGLPVQELEVEAFGDDAAKIEAKLASTSVDGELMDALVARLGALQCVDQAYWSPSTTE